jgi:hypothetical protein
MSLSAGSASRVTPAASAATLWSTWRPKGTLDRCATGASLYNPHPAGNRHGRFSPPACAPKRCITGAYVRPNTRFHTLLRRSTRRR